MQNGSQCWRKNDVRWLEFQDSKIRRCRYLAVVSSTLYLCDGIIWLSSGLSIDAAGISGVIAYAVDSGTWQACSFDTYLGPSLSDMLRGVQVPRQAATTENLIFSYLTQR